MKRVFSFCIYGNNKKYTQGLVENIKIILKYYPTFSVYIYVGCDVIENYIKIYNSYPNVTCIYTNEKGASLMCNRFFPFDDEDVEVVFSRDADSRIHERDMWCMDKFINCDKKFHIIRDHKFHTMRIMAGMMGIKKGALDFKVKPSYYAWIASRVHMKDTYNTDQLFLQDLIYPAIKNNCLIHTDFKVFADEQITHIGYPLNNEKNNFVGNVIDYNKDDVEYHQFVYISRN